MKIFAPATAAFAMLAASPALADGGGIHGAGHVGVEYGNVSAEIEGFEADEDAFAGEGALAFDFGFMGFQVDGSAARVESDFQEGNLFSLNEHLFFDGENWRLGLTSGLAVIESDNAEDDEWYFGAEGQVWMDRTALSASAVIGSTKASFSSELDSWNLDANADYYITDNFVIGAGIGWGNLESVDPSGLDTSSLRIGGEFQIPGAPVSLHAGYDRFEVEDIDISTDAFSIGARLNWGGTVKERDRAGFRHSASGGLIRRISGS